MSVIDFDYTKYLYQDDMDGEIMIFASDDIPEEKQFELVTHYETYDHFKEYLAKATSLEGSDWNNEYKCFESATFYDAEGESTTLPVNGLKLGALPKLDVEDINKLITLIEKVEEEDKESRNRPSSPVQLNMISPNGETFTATAVPVHDPNTPNHNGRIYSQEVIENALKNAQNAGLPVKLTDAELKMDAPPSDGMPISDIINRMQEDSSIKPSFSIRAMQQLKGDSDHPKIISCGMTVGD